MSEAPKIDSKVARAKGMEIVDGWVRYAIDSRARKVMPTEGSVPGWFVEGEAAAFAEQTEEAKFAHSLEKDRQGTMVFSARDLDSRNRVEGLIAQLRVEGVSCTSVRALLIAVHYKGAQTHSISLKECPPFVSGANAIGLTMKFVLDSALREFYSRLGRTYYAEHEDELASVVSDDEVGRFVQLRTAYDKDSEVPATELYREFLAFMGRTLSEGGWSQTRFGRHMGRLEHRTRKNGSGRIVYGQLRIVAKDSPEPEAAKEGAQT